MGYLWMWNKGVAIWERHWWLSKAVMINFYWGKNVPMFMFKYYVYLTYKLHMVENPHIITL